MKITTLPVYSKLADARDIPPEVRAKLPDDWRLSQHQVETYKALTGGDYDVVFNTAMTGDGKSLAAYLPVLANAHYHAFGMYPTIELSRDQERQFENYIEKFKQAFPYCALWGAELTRLAEQYEFKYRGDALKERFANYNVILTNPDIFNLVMNYEYQSGIFSPHELPYSLCTNFDYFVFDEFHIFSMPQIVSAVTAMLYIKESGTQHKFLFSSATPNEILSEMVHRGGLQGTVITGTYANIDAPDYRPVLHQAELNVHQLGEKQTAEDWLRGHLSELVAFWREQAPRPKGVVIVNSVVAARRIARMLDAELKKHGISVGENTGLTDFERRVASRQKDIIVGTSTIDVGVDFNINLLIFESVNAGTFLQRFGRLGRHRMGEAPFARYEAHALISGKMPWVSAKLEEGLKAHGVGDGDMADRPVQLAEAVRAAFTTENQFQNYARRWGVIQAAHVVDVLERRGTQGAYATPAASLTESYKRLFDLSDFGKARRRYWYLINKNDKAERKPILDEILAFRGSSPFQVGCQDKTVTPEAFIDYDLFSIVQTAMYVVMPLDDYKQAVAQRFSDENKRREAMNEVKYAMKGKNDEPLILTITEFNAEREWLRLRVSEDLSLLTEQVFVLRGLSIAEPTSAQLPNVNDVLRRQSVVCYATKRDTRELRRILHLPAHFPLYTARDIHKNRDYTLAFGKEALMLEAQLLGWRKKNVEDEPIIC